MVKLTFKKFTIPSVLLASVYSIIIYNFLLVSHKSTLDTFWPALTSNNSLTNIFVLLFIVFSVILVISARYVDKVMNKPLITFLLILVTFCSYLISTTWVVEWLIFAFIITTLAIAYLTPTLFRMLSEMRETDLRIDYNKLAFPISIILWILITGFLFEVINMAVVRKLLYIISGSITLASSIMIYNY
jgi:MFS family permease